MLLNIILLILFIIILLYDFKIIEGQDSQVANDEKFSIMSFLPNIFNKEIILFEDRKNDGRPKSFLLDLFNKKGLYEDPIEISSDIKQICKDNNIKINNLKIYTNNDENQSLPNSETIESINASYISIIKQYGNNNNNNNDNFNNNTDNNIMNFDIGGFDIDFNFESDSQPQEEEHDNYKLCDLVPILYNNKTPNEDKNFISSKLGGCFNNDGYIFKNCIKSCNNILFNKESPDDLLNKCSGSFINALNCTDVYDKVQQKKIMEPYFIKKNTEYYNCRKDINTDVVRNQEDIMKYIKDAQVIENICRPDKCPSEATVPDPSKPCVLRSNFPNYNLCHKEDKMITHMQGNLDTTDINFIATLF